MDPQKPPRGSYLDFLIGDPAYRAAKAQLSRYRSSIASEASRAEAGVQRAWRALQSFEAEARRDGEQLARTGGRHLALFQYMSGLKASLLRLELAQWRRAARLLRAREGEVTGTLERLQAVLSESEGERLDETRHLRPTAQELLAGDGELASLRRRAELLMRVCEGVEAEASLLVLQGSMGEREGRGVGMGAAATAGGAAQQPGCEGCGAGLEGPVESVEERRRRLVHLAEEACVFYFGGSSGGINGVAAGEEEGSSSEASSSAPSPTTEPRGSSGGGNAFESLQRQREVVQLRLKCEREFAFLVADERHREGRLLARWLELLREVAGEEEENDEEGDGDAARHRRSEAAPQQRPTGAGAGARPTARFSHSHSLSSSHASSTASAASSGLFPACDAPVHAPRCIAAFTQYLATKRIKEPYQLDDSVKPALVGLTQALVFRRARRVCFGYVKGSRMRRLNRVWREKMLLVRRLSPQALGVPDAYVPKTTTEAKPYHETSHALGEMALCLTPQEMSDCLLTAVRVLHVEARLASGSTTFVDADTMFPILLYALAQADVPDMYACLYCLKHFAAADYVGEKAYFITTLAAAVSHLQQLEIEEIQADDDDDAASSPSYRVRPLPQRKDSAGSAAAEAAAEQQEEEDLLEAWGPVFGEEEVKRALEYLDGWLSMELNMEETIDLLETGGWW